MLLPADKLYGVAEFLFQQDAAPARGAENTSNWCAGHRFALPCLIGQSAQLSGTAKRIWVSFEREMRDTRTNETVELEAAVRAAATSITPE